MGRWKSTARKKLRHGENQKGEDKRWRRSEMEKCQKQIGSFKDRKPVGEVSCCESWMAEQSH